jgi:hypothetical protein
MLKMVESIGLSNILILIHYVPFTIAAVIWSVRDMRPTAKTRFADVLGAFGLLVMFPLYFVISDDTGRSAEGTPAVSFLFFSVISFGGVPAATIVAHFLAGRVVGRLLHDKVG